MPLLIAVVSLLGVLCLLTLVLTLGVIRRLREHTKLMDALYEAIDLMGGPPTGLATLGKGELVGDFAATTLDGDQVTRELLPEGAVVAFLSADCGGCRDQLPEIASWAAGQDRRQMVAVLDASSGDPEELVTALSPVAQVIVEDELTTVSRAFGLKVFPTFYQVSGEGRLLAVEGKISRLPVGSPA